MKSQCSLYFLLLTLKIIFYKKELQRSESCDSHSGATGPIHGVSPKHRPQTTDLENTDLLENADLENTDLENADLENTDLENADLENADHENADLENADLENPNRFVMVTRYWEKLYE